MSVDDRESSMLGGFEGGAAFYIMMPVKYNVLKNIWQYEADKDKSVDNNHNVGAAQGEELPVEEPPVEKSPDSPIDIESVASIHGVNHKTRRDPKKRASKWVIIEESGRDNSAAVSTKRTKKVIWTRALHNRFLEAIRKIGFERAVPKRILEIMNVPGLTRENVASHLQKYRIFLKRVMETSSHGGIIGQNISDKTLRSSFATGHPSLMINTLQQGFPQFLDRQKVGSSLLQPRFLGNLPTGNGLNLSPAIFASQKASISTNPIPQLGYGQAHSMNTNALHQQKTQPRSELVPNSMSNNTFTALGVSGANSVHGIQNSSVNNSDMTLNLAGSGQMGFAGGDMLNDFNGGYGLLDGNNSTKLASSRNGNSGYFVEGASSSTRFGNTSQIPPRFSNVIQQDNNPMLLSPPMLPQLNNIGEGGEDNIYLLGQVRNISSPVDNLSIPQLAENYLHEIFVQSQPKYPSYKEKQSDGGIIRYDHGGGINQLDGNFPSFDPPYPTQQQGGAELLAHGPYNLHPESNRTWNQSADSDIMDSMFGPGMYEGGSSLPRI